MMILSSFSIYATFHFFQVFELIFRTIYMKNIWKIAIFIVKQMSRQVSRGSAGEYQADERAGVVRLRWRLLGR